MAEERFVVTRDELGALTNLVRQLPAILSGRAPDVAGIAAGFRARIGHAILSLVAPNFDELGRGMTGADGTRWVPLSPAYLAYGRRFGPGEERLLRTAAGLGRNARHAPGNKKGLLTPDQLKRWRQVYADRLAWFVMRESDKDAAAHAAAIAWIVVKAEGARTKLEVYGSRRVQILVDTGRLRGSLQPGHIFERGVDADYQKPGALGGDEQIFDMNEPTRIVVGTNVKYAAPNHRRRPFWPEHFPEEWWSQILGAAISGLTQINTLFGPGGRL